MRTPVFPGPGLPRGLLRRAPGRGLFALVLGLLLACPGPGLAADPPALGRYSNAKYGYSIEYPLVFAPQGEADAGDGQVFLAPDGQGEMRVFAAYNVLETSFQDRYRQSLAAVGGKPLYTLLREDWFVVSGLVDGKIYYEKTLARRQAFYTVAFTYDPAARALFESIVGRVIRSLQVP